MRLTHVLTRCAAVVRAAARHVGQSLGLLGRTVARAVRPAVRAVRDRVAQVARIAVPVAAVGCGGQHDSRSAVAFETTPAAIIAAATHAATPSPAAEADADGDRASDVARTGVLSATTTEAAIAPTSLDDIELEQPLGDFYMTFYYIAVEDEISPRPSSEPAPTSPPSPIAEVAASPASDAAAPATEVANDNAAPGDDDVSLAAAAGPALVPMPGRDCRPLAEVSPAFAAQVRMQGTGRLRDGRLINVAGGCACGGGCYHIHRPGLKWGTGSSGLPLAPFRMVAVDPKLVPMGSLLYIPELDGMRMPGRAPAGGFVHDGCVVAADVGGAIKGKQLDLFVGRRAYYEGLARRGSSHGWATSVEVWDGRDRCTRRGSKVSRSAAASI